jgi:penicillin-binding protein 2
VSDAYLGSRPQRDRRPIRFLTFGIITILVFGVLTTRLAYLQITNGTTFAARAEANRTTERSVPAPRGLILDSQGRPLVRNVASFAVKVTPADLPFSEREDVARRLGGLLGMDPSEILTTIDLAPGTRYDPVRVAQDVPETTARLVAESYAELPGVRVVAETRREYPEGPLFAQILGYTGAIDEPAFERLGPAGYLADDMIGKAGVESTYEAALRGTYGTQLVEQDATGRDIQVLRSVREAVPGASLRLTIDRDVQKDAEAALKWGIKAAGLKRGVFIAMNPQTGEVLALVSLPTYDNNLFAQGISNADFQALVNNKNKPLTNHAVQAHYPPGSTYKLVAGTGGLQDKKITPTTKLRTKGYLTLGGSRYYDWNRRGFGMCDLNCGFGHSSDTYFFQVAGMLGADRLAYWARQYGFGEPTGIDLPGEAAGIVPSNQWKMSALGAPMFGGEVYQAGIGQGYDVVTPIQLINAYAALANGGKLYRPQVVKDVIGPDGTVIRPFEPDLIRKLKVSQKNLRAMRLAGRATVTLRHTYNLVDMPVKVAGKSGTAEFGTRDKKGRLPFHSWFVGFVPKNPYKADFAGTDSELVFLAFAYDSRTKGNAGTEIAKAFVQRHFDIKKDYLNRDLLKRGNFYQSN